MTPEKRDAVQRALKLAHGSIRALAEEAGVSDALIRHVRDGRRRATPALVEALAEAFERLGDRHREAAELLRETLDDEAEEGR